MLKIHSEANLCKAAAFYCPSDGIINVFCEYRPISRGGLSSDSGQLLFDFDGTTGRLYGIEAQNPTIADLSKSLWSGLPRKVAGVNLSWARNALPEALSIELDQELKRCRILLRDLAPVQVIETDGLIEIYIDDAGNIVLLELKNVGDEDSMRRWVREHMMA